MTQSEGAPTGRVGTPVGTSNAAATAGASFSATVHRLSAVSLELSGPVLGASELRASGSPPAGPERLLRWVLPLKRQKEILGDLAEMYANECAKSVREARRLYWRHAIGSIVPVVMRWSLMGTAFEWLRRTLGS